MTIRFLALLVSALSVVSADSTCVPPIPSGYGSPGPFRVVKEFVGSDLLTQGNISVYRPDTLLSARYPVIFLLQRKGSPHPEEYDLLLRYCASWGNVVIFPPARVPSFRRNEIDKYRYFWKGFTEAARVYLPIIDTTRIGVIGHGYGAGAAPSITYDLINGAGWGQLGAYMFLMSPWYVHAISPRQLRSFPSHVKMIIQVYENDNRNDPRIGYDLFRAIGLPSSEKEFQIVRSDSRGDCTLQADHFTPLSEQAMFGSNNALDHYGILRMVHALSTYAFEDSLDAKNVALGEGKARECFMGAWPDSLPVIRMISTDQPKPYFPLGPFVNTWLSPRNPRIDLSRFRKARKIYFGNLKDKLSIAAEKGLNRFSDSFDSDMDVLVNPIIEGYGADGAHDMAVDSFPTSFSYVDFVYLFRPANDSVRSPVVFFIPGYGSSDPQTYQPLFRHITSRGYAVVFSPYPIIPIIDDEQTVLSKYNYSMKGITEAIRVFSNRIDTTRVAFMGQSFGGSAVPYIALKGMKQHNWGTKSAFLFITAPWYPFGVTATELAEFPPHTKMLMGVFDDDRMNDHEIAVKLYEMIGIPDSSKDYFTLYSDSLEGIYMWANHYVMYGSHDPNGQENLLDYYGIQKLFDAMADFCWNENEQARDVALGNGSSEQVYMGEWSVDRPIRRLSVTDTPVAQHPELSYMWAWDNRINPWRSYFRSKENSEEQNAKPNKE